MDTCKGGRKRKRVGRRPGEDGSLMRLAVSFLLFLVLFVGQTLFPAQGAIWKGELRKILWKETDFRQVFSDLGATVGGTVPVPEALESVWMEVFLTEEISVKPLGRTCAVPLQIQWEQEERNWKKPERPAAREKSPPEIRDPVSAAVQQTLGLEEYVTPVMGVLTSKYGMRVHPIDGEMKMHGGVDIAAEEGSDILAFSDATVDYIGESPEYGLYLQLRHDNGVTTFYAHCSKLCVQKGEQVETGEVVAKVGSTGVSTGPHLHLEMKKDGEALDPLSFIHYLTA